MLGEGSDCTAVCLSDQSDGSAPGEQVQSVHSADDLCHRQVGTPPEGTLLDPCVLLLLFVCFLLLLFIWGVLLSYSLLLLLLACGVICVSLSVCLSLSQLAGQSVCLLVSLFV